MSAASQFFGGGGGGGSQVVEVFAVGGGGNGQSIGSAPYPRSTMGGGGGSGQVVYTRSIVTPGKTYTITVGGAGSPSIFNDVVAYGGANGSGSSYQGSGGGGFSQYGPPPVTSSSGGSTTLITPVTSSVGNFALAASGLPGGSPTPAGGAGGSASWPGDSIGIPGVFGSGGGGGSRFAPGANGAPGTGNGGGGGAANSNPPAVYPAGSGGSGTVIIRFPTAFDAATVTGNTPTPAQPGYYVYRWNSGPGSITFN